MICRTCKIEKEENSFDIKNKKNNRRHTQCKKCKSDYNKRWYAANKVEHKKNASRNHKSQKEKIKKYIDSVKNSPCTDCGLTWPPEAMDFDHLDPNEKYEQVSRMLEFSLERVKTEIAKCELVCACCHRIRTHKRLKAAPIPSSQTEYKNKNSRVESDS